MNTLMKKLPSLLISTLILLSTVTHGAEPAKTVTGHWHGLLDAGSVKLHVVFHISQAAGGGLTATMDSPDQGARGIPVDSVTVTDKELIMEVKAVKGGYKGVLNTSADTVVGQWTQGPNSLPLKLTKGAGTVPATAGEVLSPADLTANKDAAQKITGTWNGALVTGGPTLRLRVTITMTATGAATGTMVSLDQGTSEIPVRAITLKEGKVRFEVPGVGGLYEGTLASDGSTLSGQWQQNGNALPLDLKKTKAE
jgi:hypothetical protein